MTLGKPRGEVSRTDRYGLLYAFVSCGVAG